MEQVESVSKEAELGSSKHFFANGLPFVRQVSNMDGPQRREREEPDEAFQTFGFGETGLVGG